MHPRKKKDLLIMQSLRLDLARIFRPHGFRRKYKIIWEFGMIKYICQYCGYFLPILI